MWERVGRGKLLLRCFLFGGARRSGAHGGGEGRGHIVATTHLQLVTGRIPFQLNNKHRRKAYVYQQPIPNGIIISYHHLDGVLRLSVANNTVPGMLSKPLNY